MALIAKTKYFLLYNITMGQGKSKKAIVIVELFKFLCQRKDYWGVWRASKHWVEIQKHMYP